MNKKGQGFMEFLMTYGWAILVVLVACVALLYFLVLEKVNEVEIPISEEVCNNLDQNGSVYFEVVNAKGLMEQRTGLRVVFIFGNTSFPRLFNDDGVMCEMNVESCTTDYLYCLDFKMIVPVNYTQWEQWYDER